MSCNIFAVIPHHTQHPTSSRIATPSIRSVHRICLGVGTLVFSYHPFAGW
jgi:hypothetical protein